MTYLPFLLMAGGGDPASNGGGGGFFGFLPFILIFAVIYFFMLRPQMKKQKDQQKMVSELKQGDEIVTIGGIHGTIAGIREKDNSLIIRVNEATKVVFDRAAVARVVTKSDGSDLKN